MTSFISHNHQRETSRKINRVKRSLVRWYLKRDLFYRLVSLGDNSMLSRRAFLKSIIVAGSAIALSSCRKRKDNQVSRVQSNVNDIKPKLDKMLAVLKSKRPNIDKDFFPGLSTDEIRKTTSALPFSFPPELEQLYMWRNGTRNILTNTADPLFIFRDHSFLPLQEAIKERENIVKYYSARDVFPFASNQGSYLVVSGQAFPYGKRFERPVINIFQGITVFFFSLPTMLDTVTEWTERNVHRPYEYGRVDAKLEREIWAKYNPDWLSESQIQ